MHTDTKRSPSDFDEADRENKVVPGRKLISLLAYYEPFLVNQLTKAEMKIDDELQALLLLSSLPKSWDTLVVTLSNSAPDGKLTTDTVTDSVLNEEARRKERGSSSYSEANVFESRGRTDNRGSDQRGQDKPRGRSKSRSRISSHVTTVASRGTRRMCVAS